MIFWACKEKATILESIWKTPKFLDVGLADFKAAQ
jgi:hypothetical protein